MFAHSMMTDLQDGKLKGISSLSFVTMFTAITPDTYQVPLLLQTCTETHVRENIGRENNFCMWVFSVNWKRSERMQCQMWAHFSWKWINSNILRVKKEFHALLTLPDIVIYMGLVCVTTEVLTRVFFPRKTQLISLAWHHHSHRSWRKSLSSSLFILPPQAMRTTLGLALKSD